MNFPANAAWLVVVAACDRGTHAPAPTPPAPAIVAAIDAAPVAASCTLAPVPAKLAAPARLVAIGDIHGDLAAARSALRAAGAIDASDRWIGGALWIVQTGDILDRGDDEQAIVDLFGKLEVDARAAGGAVIVLDGNHELMNATGDFRYVTPGGMRDWEDVPNLDTSHLDAVPANARARVAALMPGGPYAKRFAQHNVVAIVGDTVLSHAGVLGDWVTHIDDTNRAARCFLDGQSKEPPPAATADDGPLWTRAVGGPDPDCAAVKAALGKLGLARMVVGHTVQPHGITSACDGALWRIDVGLAKLYGGPIEVLELYPTSKVISGSR